MVISFGSTIVSFGGNVLHTRAHMRAPDPIVIVAPIWYPFLPNGGNCCVPWWARR
jgi:hypothetical protein